MRVEGGEVGWAGSQRILKAMLGRGDPWRLLGLACGNIKKILFYYGLLCDTEYSFLSYTIYPYIHCCVSILYIPLALANPKLPFQLSLPLPPW